MELPFYWYELLTDSRSKPSPFRVIEIAPQEVVREWTNFLTGQYMKKRSIPNQKQREVKVSNEHSHKLILHRENYNGAWENSNITNKNVIKSNEHEFTDFAY
ncbi:hypothetical protein HHI36_016896 [Cryptolaemus montrouzieri]|uniref:Uncharacterized protein n=1 Tax=Cryptolaemus montrouzieri TaxID=559131 RepID=A0ABD2NM23_9CUCU